MVTRFLARPYDVTSATKTSLFRLRRLPQTCQVLLLCYRQVAALFQLNGRLPCCWFIGNGMVQKYVSFIFFVCLSTCQTISRTTKWIVIRYSGVLLKCADMYQFRLKLGKGHWHQGVYAFLDIGRNSVDIHEVIPYTSRTKVTDVYNTHFHIDIIFPQILRFLYES
jgi:hypothetical protein